MLGTKRNHLPSNKVSFFPLWIRNPEYNGTNILMVFTSSFTSSHSPPSFISSNSLISNYYLNSSIVYFSLIITQSTDFLHFYRLWVWFFFKFLHPWIKVKIRSLRLDNSFWHDSHAPVLFPSNVLFRWRIFCGVCSVCSPCSDEQRPNESRLFPFTLFLCIHPFCHCLIFPIRNEIELFFVLSVFSIRYNNVCHTLLVASVNIISCSSYFSWYILYFIFFHTFIFDINSAVKTNQKWITRVEEK